MIILEWFLLIFAWLFFLTGVFVSFSCFVAFIRFNDFFVKLHAIKISNIYGISFILFGFSLTSGDILIFLQLFLIIILNILMTFTVVHSLSRVALLNNIPHGGFSRRKYNEMLSQKEKEEAEKRMIKKAEINKERMNKRPASLDNKS